MTLGDLEIYKLSSEISDRAWPLYEGFTWAEKKVIGYQWIRAIDSVGANIAEGFGRFHYLDKNKFNYNARGSLLEAIHWTTLLHKRNLINKNDADLLAKNLETLHLKLNNYINTTKRLKSDLIS